MKARVVALASGEGYTDGQRRVTLRFDEASTWAREISVPVGALPFVGVALDEVLDVQIVRYPADYPLPTPTPAPQGMGQTGRDLTDDEVAKARTAGEDARRMGRSGKW